MTTLHLAWNRTMVDPYRSALWHEFRQEVLRLDGYACTQCGRQRADGVRLHVHHKRYLAGHKPWEYPHDLCDTLCSGCHAAEHGIIPPKFGWEFLGYDDLGDLSGECEYCGTEIRHSFLVQHDKWGALEVGEVCCDNLTSTQLATGHLESLRRHLGRRKRFVSSPRWLHEYAGVQTIKQNGIYVELVKHDGAYRLRVYGKLGKKVFPTEVDGKAGAFDLIESGVIDEWLKKQRSKPRRR
jgi:hypothetical protein